MANGCAATCGGAKAALKSDNLRLIGLFHIGVHVFRATGLLNRLANHYFGPGIMLVVKLEQPTAVAGDVRLAARRVSSRDNGLVEALNIERADTDMVPDAELLRARRLAPHHVFDPVVAVWNHHRDPVDAVVLGAALPLESKTENVFVELVLGL